MYHLDDLNPIDLHEFLRRNQQRFFRAGVYDPIDVATRLAGEALLSDASDVRIGMQEGWVAVYANVDWLPDDSAVFSKMTPFPSGGPNAIMAEIFPVVFSRGVATATPSKAKIIKGDSLGPLSGLPAKWSRAVAYDIETV
jgi:hypothetical protein